MKLSDAQKENLVWLKKHGGSGYLDQFGRVVAGGEVRPQGCWVAWMNLVARGLVAGDGGRINVTDAGNSYSP